MTPPLRERPPSASGNARPAPSPRCRWPTSWASCSPISTASRAGASGCPSSRSGAGGARSPRPVLPRRQRRGARARDPRRAVARARADREGDPRCGHGRGRDGDARALAQSGLPPTGDVLLRRKHQEQHAGPSGRDQDERGRAVRRQPEAHDRHEGDLGVEPCFRAGVTPGEIGGGHIPMKMTPNVPRSIHRCSRTFWR